MRGLITVLCVVMLQNSAAQEKQKYPDLLALCPTQYGKVLYNRETGELALVGHAGWEANGRVRKDGKIFLLWTSKSNGEPAPGIYELIDGNLVGRWGWGHSAFVDTDGELKGSTSPETLYKVEPPKEKGDIQ